MTRGAQTLGAVGWVGVVVGIGCVVVVDNAAFWRVIMYEVGREVLCRAVWVEGRKEGELRKR